MKKKIAAVLCCMAMTVSLLTGCGRYGFRKRGKTEGDGSVSQGGCSQRRAGGDFCKG